MQIGVTILTGGVYGSFYIQIILFASLAAVLIISVTSLFIKPAKRTIRASLVEHDSGHIVDISRAETSIGRAKTCDLVISDPSVSRFHAVLSKRTSGWTIFDTHSTAGVKINGKKIDKKAILHDGDTLLFGKTEYIFYSTAVTTRQQIVKKAKTQPDDNRIRYKKRVQPSENKADNKKKRSD